MKRFQIIYWNWENLFEVHKNVAQNKASMTPYFESLDTPTITSPDAIKDKSKEEINKIAIASTNIITEEEVKILLILMKYKACGLLMNDIAPESFKTIGENVCDQVDYLSITDETTTSEIKQKYNKPTLEKISEDRMSVQ